MVMFKQPIGVVTSARGSRGFGGAGVLLRWLSPALLAWLLLALLASGIAAGQGAPQPSSRDPCQTAPNLPYCP